MKMTEQKIDNLDLDKLEEIFAKRYEELCFEEDQNPLENSSFYVDWCDKHNVIMLHPDWMMETLNDGKAKGTVCIQSPEVGEDVPPWLLVPKKFAEKALVKNFFSNYAN